MDSLYGDRQAGLRIANIHAEAQPSLHKQIAY
jgi:hypothetical protein